MAIDADDVDADGQSAESDPPLTRREMRERAAQAAAGASAEETPAATARTPALPPLPERSAAEAAAAPPSPGHLNTEAIQTVQRVQWTRGLLVLAASLIVLVSLGFAAARMGDVLYPGPPAPAALEEIQAAGDARSSSAVVDAGGEAMLHWSDSVGKAVLVVNGLPPLDEGEVYRAWFLRDDASTPAGIVATDDDGPAPTLLDGAIADGDVVTITVETDAAADQPTTDPIVRIATD